MPGFTEISMYPKMIMHDGCAYAELIEKLIELGLENMNRYARKKQSDNNVFITIKSNMSQGVGMRIIEFSTEGKLEKLGESLYLTYEESKISGLEGTTTTIKLDEDAMSVMRIGNVNYTMNFAKGTKYFNKYETNYGPLNMGIMTNDIKVTFENNRLKGITLDYDMDINGSNIGNNVVDICVDGE